VHENGKPDVQWPGSILGVWTAAALAAIGIYWVEPAVCPPGRKVTAVRYQRVNGIVTQVLDSEMTSPAAALAPQMIAAAFNLMIADGDVSSVEAMFNVLAVLYVDVGQYMIMLIDPQPDDGYSPLLLGEDGALMRVVEKGVDYMNVESRNSGGQFVDPPSFSLQVFRA